MGWWVGEWGVFISKIRASFSPFKDIDVIQDQIFDAVKVLNCRKGVHCTKVCALELHNCVVEYIVDLHYEGFFLENAFC